MRFFRQRLIAGSVTLSYSQAENRVDGTEEHVDVTVSTSTEENIRMNETVLGYDALLY
jgi:hypothetical protein